jgi:hypothetical protein
MGTFAPTANCGLLIDESQNGEAVDIKLPPFFFLGDY